MPTLILYWLRLWRQASGESKTVVAAYGELKRLAGGRADALGLTMIDCLNVLQGKRLAERLCQTGKEFLGVILRLDAVVLGKPVAHSGPWGAATLEVCLAIMESARERKEIYLQHQVPTPAHYA